ncbi:MAG TPA: hypothetical protein VMS31_17530 [Pyrinomonadaceae bacterium]|nr:hypothetical protein [Pyrinomonadaceae bacterium]
MPIVDLMSRCMTDTTTVQSFAGRQIVESLDREFARLHSRSCAVIQSTPADLLYTVTTNETGSLPSIGEDVLRSAAAVEQTFGGITANLWDDPFEWTLPEYLSTPVKVIEHLGEVEQVRQRAFSSFDVDACLVKHVATPSGETRPLVELLLETLIRAAGYQGRATATLKFLSAISTPGFII